MYCGSTPKRAAMYGTSGIRMPKPSVSMTQKRNSAASCRRIGCGSVPAWTRQWPGTSAATPPGGAGGR